MFEKILVANRGEIACRVIRTAKRLGMATVAVYSQVDAAALHVLAADEAVEIGPPPARESYLLIDRIIDAARRTGAQAIHPGYGFLSENAEFAEACAAADLTFIGPAPDAIRQMGEKAAAKALMEAAGVPVVPGYHGQDQDPDLLAREAEAIGYPVMIKAVAGGGGKGMRQVESAAKFDKALASARREARNAFGDDKVLIEKYLQRSRHIEIQIFGDSHGNVVHLFERDCSVQRRHQKVLEESPAPGMTLEMRRAMGDAAIAAAKSINYVGAGTIEFIVDVSEGLRPDRFYFMEMNTRLQVEHPVTEMVTGRDLVEWQFLVAAGGALPASQDEITLDGHAIEARIYSENPAKKFFPSTGVLRRLRMPEENPHLRIDTGVRQGDEVSIYYDPMIAKVITWDKDRATALRRMRGALASIQIAGVISNVSFLGAVSAHPAFIAGDLETGFIDQHLAELVPAIDGLPDKVLALTALDLLLNRAQQAAQTAMAGGDPNSPWHRVDGWRLNDRSHDILLFSFADREYAVTVDYDVKNGYRLTLPGGVVQARGELDDLGNLTAEIDGVRAAAAVVHDGNITTVFADGHSWRLSCIDALALADMDFDEGADVTAPLPGKILEILVAVGAKVKKGDSLMILEAMKMEHTIAAPSDAVVAALPFGTGDQVEEGVVLITFEDE